MIVVLFWFSLFSFASYRMQRECIPRYKSTTSSKDPQRRAFSICPFGQQKEIPNCSGSFAVRRLLISVGLFVSILKNEDTRIFE